MFDFPLRVIPRHADFPAQTEVERKVRRQLESILSECAAVTRAGIEELLAALVVTSTGAPRRKSAKSLPVSPPDPASKLKVPLGGIVFRSLILEVAELSAKFEGVTSFNHRENVRPLKVLFG